MSTPASIRDFFKNNTVYTSRRPGETSSSGISARNTNEVHDTNSTQTEPSQRSYATSQVEGRTHGDKATPRSVPSLTALSRNSWRSSGAVDRTSTPPTPPSDSDQPMQGLSSPAASRKRVRDANNNDIIETGHPVSKRRTGQSPESNDDELQYLHISPLVKTNTSNLQDILRKHHDRIATVTKNCSQGTQQLDSKVRAVKETVEAGLITQQTAIADLEKRLDSDEKMILQLKDQYATLDTTSKSHTTKFDGIEAMTQNIMMKNTKKLLEEKKTLARELEERTSVMLSQNTKTVGLRMHKTDKEVAKLQESFDKKLLDEATKREQNMLELSDKLETRFLDFTATDLPKALKPTHDDIITLRKLLSDQEQGNESTTAILQAIEETTHALSSKQASLDDALRNLRADASTIQSRLEAIEKSSSLVDKKHRKYVVGHIFALNARYGIVKKLQTKIDAQAEQIDKYQHELSALQERLLFSEDDRSLFKAELKEEREKRTVLERKVDTISAEIIAIAQDIVSSKAGFSKTLSEHYRKFEANVDKAGDKMQNHVDNAIIAIEMPPCDHAEWLENSEGKIMESIQERIDTAISSLPRPAMCDHIKHVGEPETLAQKQLESVEAIMQQLGALDDRISHLEVSAQSTSSSSTTAADIPNTTPADKQLIALRKDLDIERNMRETIEVNMQSIMEKLKAPPDKRKVAASTAAPSPAPARPHALPQASPTNAIPGSRPSVDLRLQNFENKMTKVFTDQFRIMINDTANNSVRNNALLQTMLQVDQRVQQLEICCGLRNPPTDPAMQRLQHTFAQRTDATHQQQQQQQQQQQNPSQHQQAPAPSHVHNSVHPPMDNVAFHRTGQSPHGSERIVHVSTLPNPGLHPGGAQAMPGPMPHLQQGGRMQLMHPPS